MEDRIDYILENMATHTICDMAKELGITKQAVHQYIVTHEAELSTDAILKRLSIGNEVWKPLVYKGTLFKRYYISNYGKLFNCARRKLVNTNVPYLTIVAGRDKFNIQIDRAVAEVFGTKIEFSELVDKLENISYKIRCDLIDGYNQEFAKAYLNKYSLPNEKWTGLKYQLAETEYDYSDTMYISSMGRVFSIRWGRFVKTARQGYPHIAFRYKNRLVHIMINRAVAYNFIPNPKNKPNVIILDNNPLNCQVDNLIWGEFQDAIDNYHGKLLK